MVFVKNSVSIANGCAVQPPLPLQECTCRFLSIPFRASTPQSKLKLEKVDDPAVHLIGNTHSARLSSHRDALLGGKHIIQLPIDGDYVPANRIMPHREQAITFAFLPGFNSQVIKCGPLNGVTIPMQAFKKSLC